ncbi:potassium voltage-gated channel protein eag [Lasius niger]|uniref:Potassium voltage-gated channel protein eag n=1 Tax=Lasius niger TaxID=67767 RepID=A0A0J7JUF7_LASNI|nr:potassium voltage-gated channel protein eag [Lasius niger]
MYIISRDLISISRPPNPVRGLVRDLSLRLRYSIGRSDADNGVQYSWLWKLANVTQSPYSYLWTNASTAPELVAGPSRRTMYVTALYFTMTCMTSVGFGNVAAETDNEKIFTICMMIIAGMNNIVINITLIFFHRYM